MAKYSLNTTGSGLVIQAESASVSSHPGVRCNWSYSVKVINPSNSGGYCVQSWNAEEFLSVDVLNTRLAEEFADYTLGREMTFGYIISGHGLRGKQKVISNDDDLANMYTEYKGKRCVLMWIKCERAPKRLKPAGEGDESIVPNPKRPSPGYSAHMKNMAEVEEILEELTKKHADTYTPEQLHAWAYMIQMKKHSSYDLAPSKPFFGKRGVPSTTHATALSPQRRINIRSECIQQLNQWHQLMEKGAISSEEYKQTQETILSDMKRY